MDIHLMEVKDVVILLLLSVFLGLYGAAIISKLIYHMKYSHIF